MRKFFFVAALIISSQLFAQHDSANVLDNVVITANKYPQKQSQTGKVISVIDKEMLEKLGGRTVGEILNTVAGTTIIGANNTLGTNQRISIRGASDGNVLLLIDGVPVNDPSVISNYFDLNFINASQIERIEILKGGQSTLYGSDAVAGVINIITKKANGKKISPYASADYGSYNTLNASAGVRGQTKLISYNAYAAGVSSKGFSSAYDSTGKAGFDNDGYHQYIFRGDLGLKLSQNVQWNFFGEYSRYKAAVDAGAFTDDKDFTITNKNALAGSNAIWKQKKGALHFNYEYNYVDRFYLDDSTDRASFAYFSRSNYIGKTHFAELYENYKWEHFDWLIGVDYRYNKTVQNYLFVSPGFSPPYFPSVNIQPTLNKNVSQISGYSSLVYNNSNWNVEAGGRWNHHSAYGNNFTYTFNPSYLINKEVKLFANISSAYKVPSLFQLYDPYSGNKNLKPEQSTTFEAGAQWFKNKFSWRMDGFYIQTQNAIQYITTNPVNFSGMYENINHQKNYGVETEFNYRGEKWNMNANYTFTKGKVSSPYSSSGDKLASDTTYNDLYRVPNHAFNTFVSYNINKKVSVSSLLKYVGKRLEPIYASAPKQLDDYFTIDVSGQYRFSKTFRAFVDLKNIANTKYFDVLGYTSRRFNFDAGVNIEL